MRAATLFLAGLLGIATAFAEGWKPPQSDGGWQAPQSDGGSQAPQAGRPGPGATGASAAARPSPGSRPSTTPGPRGARPAPRPVRREVKPELHLSPQPVSEPMALLAKTGDPLPDGVGTIQAIYAPVLNEYGTVAFIATAAGPGVTPRNNYAVLGGGRGHWTLVARAGSPIPGGGGVYQSLPADAIGPFRATPRLNDSGELAFLASYDPAGTRLYASRLGLFMGANAIAIDDDASPDRPGRAFFFDSDMANPPVLAEDGSVVFGATLYGDGFDKSANHDAAVFEGRPGSLRVLARRGDEVPGGGARFASPSPEDWLGFGPPGLFAGGAVFAARQKLEQKPAPMAYDNGFRDALYLWSGGRLAPLAKTGDPLPDGTGDIGFFYDVKHAPAVNREGVAAFEAGGRGDEFILLAAHGWPKTELLARSGRPAPGGDEFSHLSWQPSINDSREVAFVGTLRPRGGTLSSGEGLYLGKPGHLRRIAHAGRGEAGMFAELGRSDVFLAVNGNRPNLNNRGQLAFTASAWTATGGKSLGLYVFDGERVRPVVRAGETLGGKTVKDIAFNAVSSPGVKAFNDQCRIVFTVLNTDDTYGVWLADPCRSAAGD